MNEIISGLSQLATLAFAISTMLSMGLGVTVRQVIEPLRSVRFIVVALAVNFIILPAAALLLAEVLGLATDIRIGLLLISCVAGAPMVPKLAQIAKGDEATAIALVTLLIVATVVFAPLLLMLLLPGVWVDSGAIVRSLALQMLLPLAIGIFVRERWEEEATEYRPAITQISNIALAVLILTSVGLNIGGLIGLLGSGGILATVLLVVVALVAGYYLAIPAGVERRVLALGSGQRNLAAAFVIATGNFVNWPTVLVLIGLAGLVMMAILLPLAGEWSKRPSRFAAPEEREAVGARSR